MSSLPGYTARRVYTPRDIMYTHEGEVFKPGGVILSSAGVDYSQDTGFEYEIRAGWLLGRITASNLYVPCKRTQINGNPASGNSFVVDYPYAFKVGDVITVAAEAGRTITAINYGTKTITVNGAAHDWADNDVVFAEDGSGTCLTITTDFAKLRNDDNTAPAHKSVSVLLAGVVRASMVFGDLAAILAHPASAAALTHINFYTP